MNYSEVMFSMIRGRRSIRKFTDESVNKEEIEAVLEAGRWAPSGKNNQPWKFLVLTEGDERCSGLAECTKYSHIVEKAKALIVVFLDKERMYNEMKDHQGAGACIQNMLLMIHAKGLGAVWLGEIINQADQVHAALNTDPEKLELQAVLAVGRPAAPGTSDRLPLQHFLLEEI